MLRKPRTIVLLVIAFLLCLADSSINAGTIQSSDDAAIAEGAKLSKSVVELFHQRQYEKAIPLAKRAVEIYEKTLSAEDDRLRSTRRNLAELYLALGKFENANEELERVIKSYEHSPPNNPRLAEVLERRALIQFALGYLDKAEEHYKRAININESAFGLEHPKAGASLFKLAELYQYSGDLKSAEPLYQRLVSIREKTPQEKEQLKEALDRYACLLRKLKRKDEALQLEARLVENPSFGPFEEGAVGGGILNGKAITLPRPASPQEARMNQTSGKVVVHVLIDEAGNVIRACAVEGPQLLWKVSENAAYRAKFTPTSISGKPVKVGGVVTYNFVRN